MSNPSIVDQLVRADTAAPPRIGRLSGLGWLVWRQHRVTAGIALLLMVAAAGWLLAEHAAVADGVARIRQAGCVDPETWDQTPACWPLIQEASSYQEPFVTYFQLLMATVPALLGMFLGAPLLAQEYERGTHLLAWSQSVSRGRWLAARLGAALATVLVVSAVLAALTSWFWKTTVNSAASFLSYDPPFQSFTYLVLGIVPIAIALFAFAVGVTAGMLLRRTLAAVAATGAVMVAAEVALRLLRPHLWPQVYGVQAFNQNFSSFMQPKDAWLVSSGSILTDGTRVPDGGACAHLDGCPKVVQVYGYYHPVSHFWPLQLVESGLLLCLTGGLLAFVFLRLRRAR
ncbi:hypothetical protein P3T36_000303 [Kitasatospora sp. MAP12-15]|uniref:ABC transporter permease subunit n=1 Tax=unclassified Kitasatospora TaxID=2633591 RepID=UPI0024771C2A|nr:ABC transporter permease subunit [Kitasatospora sp. MAP12-44]MDH6109532.1 hypothetical protein [Kitasatospora sp. MAP12-44]